jgi:hypothetical protein
MNERDLADVLLARAIETVDIEQQVAGELIRRHAGQVAQAELSRQRASGERERQEFFLARRAAALLDALVPQHSSLAALRAAAHARPWYLIALPALALGAGLLIDLLGGGRQVNLLAAPIVAALIWNLLVYLTLALRAPIVKRARGAGLRDSLVRLSLRLRRAAESPVIATAARRFTSDFWSMTRPLKLARAAAALHLSAALFAIGAIGGMYLRGLGFEYRAGWESTFLSPAGVHQILRVVLAPGTALLGREVPGPAHLAEIRFTDHGGGENAAPWINLYAATALCLIVGPRLVLALAAAARASRLRRKLTPPEDLRRLFPATVAAPIVIEVIPYSYHLDAGAEARVRAYLEQRFGSGATIRIAPSLAFGADSAHATPKPGQSAERALLFNLAATPETEVHGALIDSVRPPPHVLVDEAPYRDRFGPDARFEQKLETRRENWRSLCAAHNVEPEFVST